MTGQTGLVALFAGFVACCAMTPVSAAKPPLADCRLPDLDEPARCGAIQVPENPDKPDGRKITIAFAVLPATRGAALPDPIVPLYGGPGEQVIGEAGYIAGQFAALRGQRDIVLVDQRGTGRSSALRCRLFDPAAPAVNLQHFLPPKAVETCANELGAARGPHPVHLPELCARPGSSPEGTGVFAVQPECGVLRHPRRTSLHACLPEQRAHGPAERRRPDRLCHAAHDGKGLAGSISRRLSRPARPIPPAGMHIRKFAASSTRCLRDSMPATCASTCRAPPLHRLPAAARANGCAPRFIGHGPVPSCRGWCIARMRAIGRRSSTEFSRRRVKSTTRTRWGSGLSITCSEDVAFLREEDIAAATAGTYLGDYRVRQQQEACRHWPQATLPADYREPVRSDIPTMFVSGDMDAATPLWFTAHMARGFPNRVEVVMRGQGHTEWNDCVGRPQPAIRRIRDGESN